MELILVPGLWLDVSSWDDVTCEFSSARLREWMAQGAPELAELAAVHDVGWIELPTGHWPQFTRPRELGEATVAALGGAPCRGSA